jgi:hypothetical protein
MFMGLAELWRGWRKEPRKNNLNNFPLADEMSGKAQNAPCGEPHKRFATMHGARMQDGKSSFILSR